MPKPIGIGLCDVNIVAEPCALKSPMSAERPSFYTRSQTATMNNEKPITRFNCNEDSGEVKKFLKNVPKAVHRATKGKQRIIEKTTKAIFAKKPTPKIVPKLPNKTMS